MALDSKGRTLPPLEKKASAYEKRNIKKRDDASAKKAINNMVRNRNPRKKGEAPYAYTKRINKLIANNQIDSKPKVIKTKVDKPKVDKPKVKKPEVKKAKPSFGKSFADARRSGKKTFMWNGKSYTTKRADDKAKTPIKSQDAKPNPSNAPRPDYTAKSIEKKGENKKTNIEKPVNKKSTLDKVKDVIGIGRPATKKEKMGRSLQRKAQASMGFKKGGSIDGCAKRGFTRAKRSR